MPNSHPQRTLAVKDRIADARRNFTASREAAFLALVGVSEETIRLAGMACEGDGSLALLDATPEIKQASQRALDQSRASILDRKLAAAIDVGLDAETSWAVHRTVGLSFESAETMFAFLYQATVEERPDMLPLSVTTVARLMRIANTAFFAAVAREMEAEQAAAESASRTGYCEWCHRFNGEHEPGCNGTGETVPTGGRAA